MVSGRRSRVTPPRDDERAGHRARTILGTLQYMAPEQLEAKRPMRAPTYGRSGDPLRDGDGPRAFAGESHVSLIGNIMNAEPASLATLEPLTPPALERLVWRCLGKSPDDGGHAHDIADDLRWYGRWPPRRRQTRLFATSPGLGPALGVAAALLVLMAGGCGCALPF